MTDAERAYQRAYQKRRRDEARREGACIVCRKRDMRPGRVTCQACALRRAELYRRAVLRARRQAA